MANFDNPYQRRHPNTLPMEVQFDLLAVQFELAADLCPVVHILLGIKDVEEGVLEKCVSDEDHRSLGKPLLTGDNSHADARHHQEAAQNNLDGLPVHLHCALHSTVVS